MLLATFIPSNAACTISIFLQLAIAIRARAVWVWLETSPMIYMSTASYNTCLQSFHERWNSASYYGSYTAIRPRLIAERSSFRRLFSVDWNKAALVGYLTGTSALLLTRGGAEVMLLLMMCHNESQYNVTMLILAELLRKLADNIKKDDHLWSSLNKLT